MRPTATLAVYALTAILCIVKQVIWGEALRDDTKNGCQSGAKTGWTGAGKAREVQLTGWKCNARIFFYSKSLAVLNQSLTLNWNYRIEIKVIHSLIHSNSFCFMKLNKYLFNTVNNKEQGRGQRSVVWLKRGQPCLHQLHVLSTVFSWRPLSSFSLGIILLPPSLPALFFHC